MSPAVWYFARSAGLVAYLLLSASVLRRRGPYGAWRKLHYLTLPAWLLASLHVVFAGTDALDPWFAAVVAGTFAAVAVAVVSRYSGRALRA